MDKGSSPKHQLLIEGKLTCGYREYAKHGGAIVYMTKQHSLKEPWEFCFPNGKGLKEWLKKYPDAVVWAIKNDGGKNPLLKSISNFKVYYSCNCHNMYNKYCDVSFVDTPARIKNNDKCKLFFKGKDPDFWKPKENAKRQYDYVLLSKRDDKNQSFFIQELTNNVKEKRKILWLGGRAFRKKVKTHHDVEYTPVLSQVEIRDRLSDVKLGILYTEHTFEGFPQAYLEMTMCGIPVLYPSASIAPKNDYYFFEENSHLVRRKSRLWSDAEKCLRKYELGKTDVLCRNKSAEEYNITKSINNIISMKK